MSPENQLAVVPAADYTVEFRAYNDDAWYSVAVFLEGETLRIKYLNFPDEHDNLFEPTGFQTLKHLDEFKERFRPLSKQLQDSECRQLVEGVKVCACHYFSDDDVRFYDAVVDGDLATEKMIGVAREQAGLYVIRHFSDMATPQTPWCYSFSYSQVQENEHSTETEEELCSCAFILFWLHGPNAGNLTATRIENICIVQPALEPDPVVGSFLKMARDKTEYISSHSISMSKGISGWEMVAYCNEEENSTCRLGFFERLQKEHRCARRSVAKVCSSEDLLLSSSRVSWHDGRPEDSGLEGIKSPCMILVGNLDKELCPSTMTEFLLRHTSVLPTVFIFPSLSLEIYTRGAIVLDSKKDFQKLCDFLSNPNCIITSSAGRPWVIIEKLVGLKNIKASVGRLVPTSKIILQNGNSGTSNNLKVVCSGTKEFKIASDLRDLFLAFSDHQDRLYKKLAVKENRIFAARPFAELA